MVQILPYLLVGPPLLYISALLLLPILQGIATSFYAVEILRPDAGRFVGLANYQRMLSDRAFWHSVWVTVYYTALVVTITIVVAMGVAQVMNLRFRGRMLARGIITLPWAFPEVAAVLLWAWMYNQQYGPLGYFARLLGLSSGEVPWLTNAKLAMVSLIVMTVWKIFPFHALVLLTALQAVPPERYEAARIDGANRWQTFRYVTIPGIAPTLMILILLLTIWSLRRFTTIWLLTGGGPASATETLVIKVYSTAFNFYELGYGAALGVAGLVLSIAVTAVYFVVQARQKLGEVD